MSDPVFILGIHDGHNCGATLSRNGTLVASVSEERLTRTKNEVGYPRRSIEEVLRLGGIQPQELSEVAYASLFMHSAEHLRDIEPWYLVGLEHQRAAAQQPPDYRKAIFDIRRKERIAAACEHLDLPEARVQFVEHHLAHLAAAYYTAPPLELGRPRLLLTCDGAGDGLAATVSIGRGNDIARIAQSDRHASLGKIYSRVTMLMGMKPWEHEYKVMGLAPYADPALSDRAAEPLRNLLRLSEDGLRFDQVGELSTNNCYYYLRDAFERARFDVVAGATQLFTEDMMVRWVRQCILHTGIADIACGGGVFMNVKANMAIAALPEVRSMYVMPSGADESLSIGACLHRYYQLSGREDHSESMLENLYLGSDYDRKEEEAAARETLDGLDANVSEPEDMDLAIADLLADGAVVARSRGRMEWGARALGNRSILSSAEDWRTVDRINRMIKQRDFWMPFAPAMRAESAARYIDDPKDLRAWFMTFGFDVRPENYADVAASSHPSDHTVRPQVVRESANPGYHKLLTRFEERTGRGAILNTSFNLHGHPIVNGPGDALHVFANSDLDHLALNHLLITRVRPS